MTRLLPLGSAASSHGGEAFARAMAIACREQFQTDFGLAVGPLPSVSDSGRSRAGPFRPGLGSRRADLSRFVRHSPRHRRRLLAKQAINLVRLALLKL